MNQCSSGAWLKICNTCRECLCASFSTNFIMTHCSLFPSWCSTFQKQVWTTRKCLRDQWNWRILTKIWTIIEKRIPQEKPGQETVRRQATFFFIYAIALSCRTLLQKNPNHLLKSPDLETVLIKKKRESELPFLPILTGSFHCSVKLETWPLV